MDNMKMTALPMIPTTSDALAASPADAERVTVVQSILQTLSTSVALDAELQCTLCHDVLCKPVTTHCGHSFCRVCLLECLLSREMSDPSCPICRYHVVDTANDDENADVPAFFVNVTLWNLIQMLVPSIKTRDANEEEDTYATLYAQLESRWHIAALRQGSASQSRRNRNRSRRRDRNGSDASDDYAEEGDSEGEEHQRQWQHARGRRTASGFPELRIEHSSESGMSLQRNIVRDTDDSNEDGYEGMLVGLAVMEFPTRFNTRSGQLECSVAMLKVEEDEEYDVGMSFFMDTRGDDDEFVMPDYANSIKLQVRAESSEVIFERQVSAQQGVATFSNMDLNLEPGTKSCGN
ncbi:hypothetical protein PINS_up000721 [Pythium insidiosum]|nr:hypothetical protein PINS_up000721 [Pythium insidiosum]